MARARHAPRLLLAVLDANPRGLAFWQREGFTEVLRGPPAQMGQRTHVRIRMERSSRNANGGGFRHPRPNHR